MKAVALYGQNDLRYETEWPDPAPGPGEVKLKITYAGICATDIEIWQRDPDPSRFVGKNKPRAWLRPVIPGHEAAGVVVELGVGVTDITVGQRVAVENVRSCGVCFWCGAGQGALCSAGRNFGFTDHGGLAEHAVWPAANCIPLPEGMSNEEAPLSEPTTVGVHAVRRSGVQVGDSAVIIGCGAVGLLTLQVQTAAGARVIALDNRDSALKMAAQLGAGETINVTDGDTAEALQDLTRGIGPDITIETAGAHHTAIDAIQWVRRGGRVVLVGFHGADPEFNFRQLSGGEKTVTGSVGADPGDYRRAVELIGSGRVNVKPLISEIVPLERAIEDGYERMHMPEKDVFRILVGSG